MARLFGLSGRLTGRKGDAVFSVRKGEQIVRQYNPMVLNPNTEAQTVQRSKMKLSSQLGAVLANVIAIPSDGAKTSRNIFTKRNFKYITRDTSVPGIKVVADLPHIQLTNSGRALCPIAVGKKLSTSNPIVSLTQNCAEELSRVVYTMVAIENDGSMRVIESHTVSEPGVDGRFSYQFENPTTNILVYAYGIKELSSKAYTTFSNTTYVDGTAVAELISSRQISAADAQLTMTVGVLYDPTGSNVCSDESDVVLVTFEANANIEQNAPFFAIDGTKVNVTCVPKAGYAFASGTIEPEDGDAITFSANPYPWLVDNSVVGNYVEIQFTVNAAA